MLLIASIAGKEGNPKMSPYSISKAGVIGLAKSVGKEYAETGITVNALAPAAIYTSMLENATEEAVVSRDAQCGCLFAHIRRSANPKHRRQTFMKNKIPMKRFGKTEELAATAAWVVSPEASFNTGFTFDLSGGRAVY